MSNEPIDDRYNIYVPYNWKQVANAFSTAISYTWTAIQTFTAGIKTNDIFCETNGAIEATLYSDVGFGRDVVIGNALSNTKMNNVSALTASSGCNILINQVGGIASLCDAPSRTAPLNIYCRSAEAFDLNTIKIGTTSGGSTTTELNGITKISNPLSLNYTTATTAGTLGNIISDPSTSSVILSTTFSTIRTITLTAGTWIITGSVSENNASGTEVGGVVLLYNNTASANIRVVYDEFPIYAYSTAPIVTFLYVSVSSVIQLRASLNGARTGVSAIGESYLQAVRIG